MVLAFSGWMDGGDVSTGTVEWLVSELDARKVARIDPEEFYIYSFPGSMETSALFRPHTRIKNGLIKAFVPPRDTFYCSEEARLVFFSGKEPNYQWRRFADCIFEMAAQSGVSTIYFVGSVAGFVPHTREPRIVSVVSEEGMKPGLQHFGISFSSYEGPASFATYLMTQAHERGLRMATLVAEIPPYVQGTNPKCIEAVIRKLAAILEVSIDTAALETASEEWERRLADALDEKPDLAAYARKLEEDFDNEVFDTQMGDLKQWLQQHGIRVD
jgi:proteasome assembly chaperone (PAC2) family protein